MARRRVVKTHITIGVNKPERIVISTRRSHCVVHMRRSMLLASDMQYSLCEVDRLAGFDYVRDRNAIRVFEK